MVSFEGFFISVDLPVENIVENVKMGKIIGSSRLILDDYRIIKDVSE